MSDDQVPDFDIRKCLSMVFATPLVVHDRPNSELQELVLGKEADDVKNGITRSNAGGWQSAGNLITWKERCIETFRQRIEKLVTNLLQDLIRDEGKNRSFSAAHRFLGQLSIAGAMSCTRIRTACGPASTTSHRASPIPTCRTAACWNFSIRERRIITYKSQTPYWTRAISLKTSLAECCCGPAG